MRLSSNSQRSRRPVFVMGCHRSGTNLLYDILLSAGGFAIYRGYIPVHKVLIPRFGRLHNPKNREKLMQVWLRSKAFHRSELDRTKLTAKILADCRNGGDFIRIHMEEIARRQHVERWAVYDPDTVLYMRQVKQEIPEALFIHIIRDGRDIALSLKKMGGFKPFPWDRENRSLNETALYWRWTVEKGREYGREIPNDYMEVHYEGLIREPRESLAEIGRFLDHELDYARIQATGLGRLRESNSSFRDEGQRSGSAVERWKERLSATEIAELEALIGDTLEQLGYSRATPGGRGNASLRFRCLRSLYPAILDSKYWLKTHTPLGKFVRVSPLELDPENADDAIGLDTSRARPESSKVSAKNFPPKKEQHALTGFQYRLLMRFAPQPANGCTGTAYLRKSKVETLLGRDIHTKIRGKTIIDFGCGEGLEAIEFARRGAELVIGIDSRKDILAIARQNAMNAEVARRCQFFTSTTTTADLIVSLDSFEHFQDPAAVLREMEKLLKPEGQVIAGFGPTWYHPLGGHLFSVFPWAHLLFSEEALIRWRANFRTDGATKFSEVAGGLNQMTIKRFEKVIEESPFRLVNFDLVPIRKLRHFHNRATREFTTAIIRCTLVRRDMGCGKVETTMGREVSTWANGSTREPVDAP